MGETFENLGISPLLIKALKAEKINNPTDIQINSVPVIIPGRDVIMHSPTGTGKTLAYLLPLFETIKLPAKELKAIIIAPTHELVIQIQRQIERLSANSGINVTSTPIIGGANITRQTEKLKTKPQIIVGSPGRILELIQKKKIRPHTVKTLIIDEADRLLDINNITPVLGVIKTLLKQRQLIIASATMPAEVIETAKGLMNNPSLIKSGKEASVPELISHIFFRTEQRDKIDLLKKLIKSINPGKALVFINSTGGIDNLTSKLRYSGIKAESLHGTNFKKDRKKVMDDFRGGKLQVLIASDIAARGLQMDGITHVFNMDIPEKPDDYLHRAGRTGRNSTEGTAVSIATADEIRLLKKTEKELKIIIENRVYFEGRIIKSYPEYKKRKPVRS